MEFHSAYTLIYRNVLCDKRPWTFKSRQSKNYPVKEDDLVIVNPLASHTERGIENVNFEYIVMGIEGVTYFSKKKMKNKVVVLPIIVNINMKFYFI